jgi:hypothetical protein
MVDMDVTYEPLAALSRARPHAPPARPPVPFDESDARELRSAEAALPILFELHRPTSVLHVGCGIGAWLSWFERYGVDDCTGVALAHPVDGLTHVTRDRVVVSDVRAPFRLDRRFDLVVALELASRVPAEDADALLDNLVEHGDMVLFSAAVPGQRGTQHVNAQWPQYWIERFDRRGFVAVDGVRPRWWNVAAIDWPYRQNTFLMVSEVRLANSARMRVEHEVHSTSPVAMVHPECWLERHGSDAPVAAVEPTTPVKRNRRTRRDARLRHRRAQ